MTAQVLNGNAAWDFLDRDWPRLYEADPTATPYQSATWLSAWATHLDATATPLVLSMPGAALALVRRPEPDGTQRVAPLSAPHAEYVGPVGPAAQGPATAAHFTTHLEQLADDESDIIELTDIPATCAWAKSLTDSPRWRCEPTPCANVLCRGRHPDRHPVGRRPTPGTGARRYPHQFHLDAVRRVLDTPGPPSPPRRPGVGDRHRYRLQRRPARRTPRTHCH